MATTFKTFLNNDIATARSLLHEAIPITGTIVSGTYNGTIILKIIRTRNVSISLRLSIFKFFRKPYF